MAKKDPAALFFIDTWLTATAEMKADCRGWYLNLILHQFDKKDLPDDIEDLASLAGVRHSEYTRFEQVFKQELEHKFERNSRGRLENPVARQILRKREDFKEKREVAGRMSYFIRFVRKHLSQDENLIMFLKKNAKLDGIDIKNEQVLEQVFKQTSELFINGNGIINTDSDLKYLLEKIREYESVGKDQENLYAMIVLKMVEAFRKENPDYFFHKETDYHAALQIAYHIAEMKHWKRDSVLNGNMDACVKSWEKIVQFVKADRWFATRSLTDLSTIKEWQRLVQSMKNVKHESSKPTPTNTGTPAKSAGAVKLAGILRDEIATHTD
jgi:hypothetical protein